MIELAHAAEGHRRELLVHCYRMLGSLEDAEDAVQETLLRAWRYRDSLQTGAPLRPWLYRIATNVCLDAIARDARRAALAARTGSEDGADAGLDEIVWLQPIPDAVLEPATPPTRTPEGIALTREAIELAFLTVIQLLTPQQRAALILCDVLDWSAKEAADLLDVTVPAVNSALQRARSRLRARLPTSKPTWPAGADASAAERELMEKYVAASEAADFRALESIIRADATCRMPPQPGIATGRDEMFRLWLDGGFGTEGFGRLHCIVTRANRQPAVAAYVRRPGDAAWHALAMDVLRIEEGLIAEIVTFSPECFPSFGLPLLLDQAREIATRH